MFSLGPGSVCDVCLESFGQDLKAPCSIACGHVFCASCIHHITRQICPLCRSPFDPRSIVKLHIDLDGIKLTSAGGDEPPSAQQEARTLHERIAAVANAGTTEANLRALISECKTFLSNHPRNLFQDLRVSLRMIAYLCEVKSTLRSQNQVVDQTQETLEKNKADYNDLQVRFLEVEGARKDAVNAKKKAEAEKKNIQANAIQRELELTQKVSETQNKYIDLLEQLNQQKVVSDGLRQELHSVNASYYKESADYSRQSRSDSSMSPPEWRPDRADLRGLSAPEQEFLISPLPEFTSNALAADNFIGLPNEDDPAGTPADSSSCAPSPLFVPAEETPSNPSTVPHTPSLLSLTAPKFDELGHRLSRSHSFTNRSFDPSRQASPVVRPIEDHLPNTVHNPHERNSLLRNQFHDLLTDTPADGPSSLPSSVDYFPNSSSRRTTPRSFEVSSSPAPIPIPSVQPTTSITTAGSMLHHSTLSQRPALSRASSHAAAMENAQRERKKETGDRRRSDRIRDRAESLRDIAASETSLSVSPNIKVATSPIPQTSYPDSERMRPAIPISSKPERSPSAQNALRDSENFSPSSVNRYGSSESERHTQPIGVPHSTSKRDPSRTKNQSQLHDVDMVHLASSSSSRTKNHSQLNDIDGTAPVPASSSIGRSSFSSTSPTSFKAPHPSRDRDTYQYPSSIGSTKGKALVAAMTATNTSVAGFA
jgi:hypothetical protein